jgi:hypothetical protein
MDLNSYHYQSSFLEGTRARLDNKTLSDNPYPITDRKAVLWNDGWVYMNDKLNMVIKDPHDLK